MRKREESFNYWPAISDLMLALFGLFLFLWFLETLKNKGNSVDYVGFRTDVLSASNKMGHTLNEFELENEILNTDENKDPEAEEIKKALDKNVASAVFALKELKGLSEKDRLIKDLEKRSSDSLLIKEELSTKLQQANSKIEKLTTELQQENSGIGLLTKELQQGNSEIEKLKKELQEANKQIQEFKTETIELKGLVNKLSDEDKMPALKIEGDLVFDKDKDTIKNKKLIEDSFEKLLNLIVKHDEKVTDIMIVGFTDQQGALSYNADLGLRRAYQIGVFWEEWIRSQDGKELASKKRVHTFSAGETEAKQHDAPEERKIEVYLMGVKE